MLQATKYQSPSYNEMSGRMLIYSNSASDPTNIFTTKILNVSADNGKGLGIVTGEYVFRGKTHQITVERSLGSDGRAMVCYAIFSEGKLVAANWKREQSKPVPLTGTSAVMSRVW